MQRIHDEQNAKIISKGKTQQSWDQEMTNDVSSASAESDSVLFKILIFCSSQRFPFFKKKTLQ